MRTIRLAALILLAAIVAPVAIAGAGGGPSPTAERVVLLGRSVDGRPIRALRLGDPSSPHKALVVGVIHGNETAGVRVVRQMRHRYAHIRGLDLWTVFSVNPDGMAKGTRTNAHGVDLNRNFSYRWRDVESPGSDYYQGRRPFSEPESRLLARLIRRLRPSLTIYYHQPWGQVLAPCHGNDGLERRYSRISRVPLKRCRGENLRGTATSWQEHHFPNTSAFVVEFPSGSLTARATRRNARAALVVARLANARPGLSRSG